MPDGDCVYSCRHPLWGGTGSCFIDDGPDAEPKCLCDGNGRYVPEDPFGNPSCVLKRALLGLFMAAAAFELSLATLIAWNIKRYWRLPLTARRGRRAMIWQRLSALTSFYIGITGVIFAIAAGVSGGNGSLQNTRLFQGWYTVAPGVGMVAAILAVELWVDSLPSQLLAAEGFVTRLKTFAEERGVFIKLGLVSMSTGGVMGVAACIFPDMRQIIRGINFLCCACALLTAVTIFGVALHISHLIDRSALQVPATRHSFYTKAKRKMWVQAAALCTLAVALCGVVMTWELTLIGLRTQTIPWLLMALIASTGFTMAVHFSRIKSSDFSRQVAVAAASDKARFATSSAAKSVKASMLPPFSRGFKRSKVVPSTIDNA